jgi:adenosylmethionine-8-amino-7-oxononanoate aminotransferase
VSNRSAVFHRSLEERPILIETGVYGILRSPEVPGGLIDLSSGAGVTCLGHSVQPIKEAMIAQINRMPYVHSNFTNEPVEQLAECLLQETGFKDGGAYFLNSGAEAVEAACKLAIQYSHERKFWGAPEIFAREHSYHGHTLFTLALGDHPRKEPYAGYRVPHIVRFRAFKPSWDQQAKEMSRHDYRAFCIGELRNSMHQRMNVRIGAPIVIVEPIGGTTLGIEPGDAEYLADIRSLCDSCGAILIYDEVLCGNYRTGHLFAWQYFAQYTDRNLAPDLIAIGKGLTAGYFPLSAVIVNKRIREVVETGSKRLWHSTTNQNHPIGCAAGIAALTCYKEILGDSVGWSWAHNVEDLLLKPLDEMSPWVYGYEGVGALFGMRLDPDILGLHMKVRKEAKNFGLALYTEGGTVKGRGNFILIAPPYCMEKQEIEVAAGRLRALLHKVCCPVPA